MAKTKAKATRARAATIATRTTQIPMVVVAATVIRMITLIRMVVTDTPCDIS